MTGKIAGYREFESKKGNTCRLLTLMSPYSDRDKEKGAVGNRTEDIFLPDELYKVVETVYMWHPSISKTVGKEQMASLYNTFGMEKEYIELFGKKYLKCTSCKYGKDGHCSLFDCSYGNSDGCEEKTIKNAEAQKESA